ncbi:MAG: hypothetical protein KJZ65_02745 [Phycisphaerales bacterium]|nr:hypothetical protein [Phycisphaerales bacterium]
MPGRSHKPLFEHLAKAREENLPPVESPRAPVLRTPAPRPTAAPGSPTPALTPRQPIESAPTSDRYAPPPPPAVAPAGHGRLTLSYAAIYGFVAAALALAVAAWSIGYRVGFGAGERSWAEQTQPTNLPPAGPLAIPNDSNQALNPVRPGNNTSTDPPRSENQAQPPRTDAAATTAGILSPSGTLYADPRVSGSNYLELATLSRDQADAAIQFLASRGVPAIAVPVDSRQGTANNPARYRLVSMKLGIPSEQYRDTGAQRRAHEEEVKRLGAEWQANGGASNFAKPLWTRFP